MSYPEYNITDTLTNDVNVDKLKNEIQNSEILSEVLSVTRFGASFNVLLDPALTGSDIATLDAIISSHEHITTAESLKSYLNNSVFPFVENLIATFAAENISMGITQAQKTADLLGLFEKKYIIGGSLHPVSLKGSFDTGSLYVSLEVIEHIRNTPSDFTGLGPFVTDDRLLEMKNKIELFLGVTPIST